MAKKTKLTEKERMGFERKEVEKFLSELFEHFFSSTSGNHTKETSCKFAAESTMKVMENKVHNTVVPLWLVAEIILRFWDEKVGKNA